MVNNLVHFSLGLLSAQLATALGFPVPDLRGIAIMAMTAAAYIAGRIVK